MRNPETTDISDIVVEVCNRLQTWEHGLSILGVKEVLGWVDEYTYKSGPKLCFAFRGDALRIQNHAFHDGGMLPNEQYHLDYTMQKALGFAPQLEYRGMRAWGIRSEIGQTMSDDTTHISETLDALSRAIETAFELEESSVARVTLMPSEGEPWTPGTDETYYYSTKKRKWLASPRPDWITEACLSPSALAERECSEAIMGADFCRFMPVLGEQPSGYASAFISGWGEFIVTHSVDFQARGQWKSGGEYERLRWDIHASYINSCGGFLFPSLAVGQIPAAMFGLTNLIFDPAVVLAGMKPYAGRGRWPIVTYTTDVWTETMSKFLGEASISLFEQLTGQWHIGIYGHPHMYILGPPVEEEGGMFGGGIVPNTKRLSAELKRRSKVWKRGLSGSAIEDIEGSVEFVDDKFQVVSSSGENRYPYLEAKANGIISPRALAACTCPDFRADETEQFLNAIGFGGDFLVIPATPEERALLNWQYEEQTVASSRQDRLEALYEYSWRVYDAVTGLGKALTVQLR